jgi:hypothetical protein
MAADHFLGFEPYAAIWFEIASMECLRSLGTIELHSNLIFCPTYSNSSSAFDVACALNQVR